MRQLGGLTPIFQLLSPNVPTPIVRQTTHLLHYLSVDEGSDVEIRRVGGLATIVDLLR